MDWAGQMAMFDYPDTVVQQQEEEVDDDYENDFYGNDDPNVDARASALSDVAGSSTSFVVPAPVSVTDLPPVTPFSHRAAETGKTENQLRAQELRARLIAQRQNTPAKSASRAATPLTKPSQAKPAAGLPAVNKMPPPPSQEQKETGSGIMNELDELIFKGKAAAEQQVALESEALASPPAVETNGNSNHGKVEQLANDGKSLEVEGNLRKQVDATHLLSKQPPTDQGRSARRTEVYYDDLTAWLEITGYHDIEFRNAQLENHRKKQALQAEMARIQEQLAQLDQAEQNTPSVFRFRTPIPHATAPPLPTILPASILRTNGVKREHSPDAAASDKFSRRESGGYRIRGAVNSPIDARAPDLRSRNGPASPSSLSRRISFPESRRRPDTFNDRERDPSLERRHYNRRDGDARTDHYSPSDQPPRQHDRGSLSGRSQHYRGSAGLDLRKGGQ